MKTIEEITVDHNDFEIFGAKYEAPICYCYCDYSCACCYEPTWGIPRAVDLKNTGQYGMKHT